MKKKLGEIVVPPGAVAFADMASVVKHPELSTAGRHDPYWEGLFGGGPQAWWLSRVTAERRADYGVEPLPPAGLRWGPDEALEALTSGRPLARRRRMAAIATMAMWRTVTDEQLAAFVGRQSRKRFWDEPQMLWAAGVAEVGIPRSFKRRAATPKLYRLRICKRLDRVLDELSYEELISVNAGQKITAGPQHDRHNVLAAELALRVAEYCDIGTVLGESVCGRHFFDVAGTKRKSAAAADAAFVRKDGLRILIELTATARADWGRKVDKWVEALMRFPPDVEPGWMVLFVEADRSDKTDADHVWLKMRRDIETAMTGYSGAVRRRVRERFAIARWSDWFPTPGYCNPGFTTLRAERPTGRNPDDRWQQIDLLDPAATNFTPTPKHLGILNNSLNLYGVPSWLREDQPFNFAEMYFRQAGLDPAKFLRKPNNAYILNGQPPTEGKGSRYERFVAEQARLRAAER